MIFLGADHRGFDLKEKIKKYLEKENIEHTDCGVFSKDRADFPLIAKNVCSQMDKEKDTAILICGSGIGMTMAANKIKGIRAGTCFNAECAKDGKEHSNINCLVLPGDFIDIEQAKEIIHLWLNSQFLGGRYLERVQMIQELENEN